jgi:predicted transposase YdaD
MCDIGMLPRQDRFAYYQVLERYLSPSFLELPEVAMLPIELRRFQEWIDEAMAEGRAEGRAEAMAEGRAEGEAKGMTAGGHAQQLRTITRLLGRRVALPGPEALARMEALPLETLEQLAEDLLDFSGPDDLDAWLARH